MSDESRACLRGLEELEGYVRLPTSVALPLLVEDLRDRRVPTAYAVETYSIYAVVQSASVALSVSAGIHTFTPSPLWVPLLSSDVALQKSTCDVPERVAFGVRDGYYGVFTEHRGRLHIQLEGLISYSGEADAGINLQIVPSAQTLLKVVVPAENALVSVAPTTDLSISRSAGQTVAEGNLPATTNISVHWIRDAESVAPHAETRQPLTCSTAVLHAVGEGRIATTAQLAVRFARPLGTSVTLLAEARARVVDVRGPVVRSWSVPEGPAAAPASDGDRAGAAAAAAAVQTQSVVVTLERPEDELELTVLLETGLAAAGGTVALPAVWLPAAERETGHVAVEARTSIEITEQAVDAATRIDAQELPSTLSAQAERPIVLAYKFISAPARVTVAVKRHADVDVLTAVLHECTVGVVLAEGRLMYHLWLKMSNTRTQFLRVTLPRTDGAAEVWSCSVGGAAVKPGRDEQGRVLLPLLKQDESDAESGQAFWAELVFVLPGPSLARSGRVRVQLPAFDLPACHMSATVAAPSDIVLRADKSDLTLVEAGTARSVEFVPPPPSMPVSEMVAGAYRGARRVRAALSNVAVPPMTTVARELDARELRTGKGRGAVDGLGADDDAADDATHGRSRGVLPVRMEALRAPVQLRFERLLVMGADLSLHVRYRRRGWLPAVLDRLQPAGGGAALALLVFVLLITLALYVLSMRARQAFLIS